LQIFNLFQQTSENRIFYKEFLNYLDIYNFADLNDKVGRVILDLREIIRANNIDLKELFNKIDKSQDKMLDREEFIELLQMVAKDIPEKDIDRLFQKFDKNNDGTISFKELSAVFN